MSMLCRVEYGSVQSFSEELDQIIKAFGSVLQVQDRGAGKDKIGLLRHLLQDEADRLKVSTGTTMPMQSWNTVFSP